MPHCFSIVNIHTLTSQEHLEIPKAPAGDTCIKKRDNGLRLNLKASLKEIYNQIELVFRNGFVKVNQFTARQTKTSGR